MSYFKTILRQLKRYVTLQSKKQSKNIPMISFSNPTSVLFFCTKLKFEFSLMSTLAHDFWSLVQQVASRVINYFEFLSFTECTTTWFWSERFRFPDTPPNNAWDPTTIFDSPHLCWKRCIISVSFKIEGCLMCTIPCFERWFAETDVFFLSVSG